MHEKAEQWEEVMELAKKYEFIRFAYAGVALLSIDKEEVE